MHIEDLDTKGFHLEAIAENAKATNDNHKRIILPPGQLSILTKLMKQRM